FLCSHTPPVFHSFPTRRSSDLRFFDIHNDDAFALRGDISVGARDIDPPRIGKRDERARHMLGPIEMGHVQHLEPFSISDEQIAEDRKSTRLNSSHLGISYAVFC